jgi:type 1 glutamine amidotransferase
MRKTSSYLTCGTITLIVLACGGETQSASDLNDSENGDMTSAGDPPLGMSGSPEQQDQGEQQGGMLPADSEGRVPVDLAPSPSAGGGNGGSGMPAEGAGGSMAMEGSVDPVPAGPYAPREGDFKMLVYSRTTGFRHDSIAQGKTMLQEIAAEQGFEITAVETNELITTEGLAQFEIVFFMNSTGDIFNQTEEAAFEEWMETKNGAFAGVHSATDTEQGWAFYKEVTGQYYNGHVAANTAGAIQFEASMAQFPAVAGMPNPWQRNEEWYFFNNFQEWSTQPGLMILGRKAADNQPIVWAREFGNWRSFYTALGHDAAAFRDPLVKQHVTGGIMWAVRRAQLSQ